MPHFDERSAKRIADAVRRVEAMPRQGAKRRQHAPHHAWNYAFARLTKELRYGGRATARLTIAKYDQQASDLDEHTCEIVQPRSEALGEVEENTPRADDLSVWDRQLLEEGYMLPRGTNVLLFRCPNTRYWVVGVAYSCAELIDEDE